jgi:hypothetical protein
MIFPSQTSWMSLSWVSLHIPGVGVWAWIALDQIGYDGMENGHDFTICMVMDTYTFWLHLLWIWVVS